MAAILPATYEQTSASPEVDATISADPGAWWQALAAPGLEDAIVTVLRENYDIQAAAAQWRATAAQAELVAGASLPQLSANLQSVRSRSVILGFPIPGAGKAFGITSTRHQLGLDLSYEADLWGRLDAEEQAAIAALDAQSAELDGLRLQLSGQATSLWWQWVGAQESLRLRQRQVELAQAQLEQLERAFRQGGPSAPLASAEAGLAARRLALHQAQAQVAKLRQQFATLLGAASQDLDGLLPAADLSLPETLPPLPVGLPSTLLERRPDLAAAAARVRAADARYAAADAALYPSLRLTASGGSSSDALSDLLKGDFRIWSLAGGLTAPLFQGGRLRAQRAAEEAGSQAAAWSFAQAVLNALHEVEQGLVQEQTLRAQQQALADVLAARRQRLAQAEAHFRHGTDSAAAHLQAQSELLDAELQAIDLRLALVLNRIRLHLALGGSLAQ